MTTRDYADAYADDSENVRTWPALDTQEPEPEPAPCNCHEHLVYRASLAFNSDREREFALEGDPIDLWNRLAAVTAQLVAALDIIALHEANIARLTYDRDHPYGGVA